MNGDDLSNMSMMDLFRMEAENHCAALNEGLLALEKDPDSQSFLESLMRAAHSIKGAARIIDLGPAVKIAHAMEDTFVAAQQDRIALDRDAIDLLLKSVDMLSSLAQVPDENSAVYVADHAEEIGALVNNLRELAENKNNAVTSEATSPSQDAGSLEPEPSAPPSKQAPETPPDLSGMSMMDLFRMEAENHCAALNDGLLALEKDPDSQSFLESLMRAAHSIKGAARIIDLDPAVKIAHAMEDTFVAAQQNKITLDGEGIDLLLKSVDTLSNIAGLSGGESDAWLARHAEEVGVLTENIRRLACTIPLTKTTTQKKPAAIPPPQEKSQPTRDHEASDEPRINDRAVRVSAEGLNRLMGLAGEIQIESRWLPSFTSNLVRLKHRHDELQHILDTLSENITGGGDINLSKRLKELRHKVSDCRAMVSEDLDEMEDHARRTTEISYQLYHEVILNRMRPFIEGVRGFPRMVRDLARELGKEVNFEIIGEDTLVDRDILEKIESPLNHLLRNALDHGIESPEERENAGKSREATLRLGARHISGMLNILVEDDGRGIDLEKLRSTIVAKKMISETVANDLSDAELMEFLFLPNFSTKKAVTKISGRGVGLDVVHSVVHEVRGVVHASTKKGMGSSFEMQLPLTLSVMRALLVEIANEPYAFPLVAIDRIVKVPEDQIKEIEGRQYFSFAEKRIGIVSARQILGKVEASTTDSDSDLKIVMLSDRLNQYGLIVDKFLGIHHLVVHTLDPRLGKVKDISAAAILEDGSPVLIVDVEDMVRSIDHLISDNRLKRIGHLDDISGLKRVKRILVADDSITVREVERKMLETKGYEVDVAVDGMDAWNTVRNENYDLLVTDIDMPRMNGFELVDMVRSTTQLSGLPIIIVSYKDREEDRRKGLEAGADYYLTKGSFHDQTLVKAVKELIGDAAIEHVEHDK